MTTEYPEFRFIYTIKSVDPVSSTAVVRYDPMDLDVHSIEYNIHITDAIDENQLEKDILASAPLVLWRQQKKNKIEHMQSIVGRTGELSIQNTEEENRMFAQVVGSKMATTPDSI